MLLRVNVIAVLAIFFTSAYADYNESSNIYYLADLGVGWEDPNLVERKTKYNKQNKEVVTDNNKAPSFKTPSSTQSMPSVPIDIDNEKRLVIGPNHINLYSYKDNYYADIGLRGMHLENGDNALALAINAAHLLRKYGALGTNLYFSPDRSEAMLNGLLHFRDKGLQLKGSAGYMWGKQNFNFASGKNKVNLSQTSYYFSAQQDLARYSNHFQSFGISTWGARARQNNTQGKYFMQSMPSSYNLIYDPLKLSLGKLSGLAIDVQVALRANLVGKASLGREKLDFNFASNANESNKRIYQNVHLYYEPALNYLLEAEYQRGASESQVGIAASYKQWKASYTDIRGQNGIVGSKVMMLSYDLNRGANRSRQTLAERMHPTYQRGSHNLSRAEAREMLIAATTRPSQLPQSFLAKVDTTAVKTLRSVCKRGIGDGMAVDEQGQVMVMVGSGAQTITQLSRNNALFQEGLDKGMFAVNAAKVKIQTLSLPTSATPDLFSAEVTDVDGVKYRVEVDTITTTAANPC